jgi:hypothetical protein
MLLLSQPAHAHRTINTMITKCQLNVFSPASQNQSVPNKPRPQQRPNASAISHANVHIHNETIPRMSERMDLLLHSFDNEGKIAIENIVC